MKKISLIIMFSMFGLFLVGFLFGYFFKRVDVVLTENKLEDLRRNVENMQLERMFIDIESPEKSCDAMITSVKETSYNLYDMVNRLKQTEPVKEEFYDIKREADLLSLKAWMLSIPLEEKCGKNILPILYIYSTQCQSCDKQDGVLQKLKNDYDGLLVYAIDYNTNEPVVELIKNVYNVSWTPAMIIKGKIHGVMDESELSKVICSTLNCTVA